QQEFYVAKEKTFVRFRHLEEKPFILLSSPGRETFHPPFVIWKRDLSSSFRHLKRNLSSSFRHSEGKPFILLSSSFRHSGESPGPLNSFDAISAARLLLFRGLRLSPG